MYKNSVTEKLFRSLFKLYNSALAESYTIRLLTSLGKKIKVCWLNSFISIKFSFLFSDEARKNSVIFNIAIKAINFIAKKILFVIEALLKTGLENSKLIARLAIIKAPSTLKVNPLKGSITCSLLSKFWLTED